MTALATSPLPSAKSPALTAQGSILGTFQYMAPEQIEGVEADARTDIFAFGAVLYEMITGKRAFSGRSQASLMSAIMKDEPAPVSQALPVAPPALDQILRHCLAKDPDDRFQTAHDLLLQLRWVAEGSGTAAPASASAARPARRPIPVALLGGTGLIVLAIGAGAGYVARPAPETRITRFAVAAPPKGAFGEALAVSPDGKRLAFLASADGVNMVWIRTLDVVTAQPMPGTEGANVGVFWSPDGAHIGFFADGKLKRAPVGGGPIQKICDATLPSGGTWGKDDVIVFAAGANEGLSRVAAAGGQPTVITTLDASKKENSHRWPAFLPDGRHFLYLARNISLDNSVVYAASVDDPAHPTQVLVTPSSALFAPPGYLLFVRERSLMAQPFDPGALRTTGDAFPVAENVGASTTRVMLGAFSVSDTGVLAYGTGTSPNRQYAWFDRAGKELSRLAPIGQFTDIALAPGDTRAAVREDVAGNADIWILDLIRGVPSRLTFDPAVDWFPVWSADGSRVIFYSTRSAAGDIYQKQASGTSADELLLSTNLGKLPSDASRDGRFLMYSEVNPKTKYDLWVLPLAGDKKPVPYLVTPFNDADGHFSPDGKWVAYMSDENGKPEVYIQSFPASGGKAQISNGGGSWPRWRGDGKELFYLAPDRKLMAAPIKAGALDGVPVPLFETQVDSYTATNRYAPAADGQRFLVNVPNGAPVSTPLTVVLNWTAGFNKK
jgi:Tol biopolymer transport system component